MLDEWSFRGHLARAFVVFGIAAFVFAGAAIVLAVTGSGAMAWACGGTALGLLVCSPIVSAIYWFGGDRGAF